MKIIECLNKSKGDFFFFFDKNIEKLDTEIERTNTKLTKKESSKLIEQKKVLINIKNGHTDTTTLINERRNRLLDKIQHYITIKISCLVKSKIMIISFLQSHKFFRCAKRSIGSWAEIGVEDVSMIIRNKNLIYSTFCKMCHSGWSTNRSKRDISYE